MARPTELTVTYSRKNNLGDYSNEDVFLAVKLDLESGDDIRAVADEYFNIITEEVDRNSTQGAKAIVRESHGNVPPPEQPPKNPSPAASQKGTTPNPTDSGTERAPPQEKKYADPPNIHSDTRPKLNIQNYKVYTEAATKPQKDWLLFAKTDLKNYLLKQGRTESEAEATFTTFCSNEFLGYFGFPIPESRDQLTKGQAMYLRDRLEASFPAAFPKKGAK